MVSFQQKHVFPFRYGDQEADHLRVFYASVDIISKKDVKFILLHPALSVQILLQNGITAMQVSDVVDSPVSGQVNFFQPYPFQFLRPDGNDSRRNLLTGQAAVHPLDHLLRYPF